jgi:hypothetical protein
VVVGWLLLFVSQNPGYMKENFIIVIESLHLADAGMQHNVSHSLCVVDRHPAGSLHKHLYAMVCAICTTFGTKLMLLVLFFSQTIITVLMKCTYIMGASFTSGPRSSVGIAADYRPDSYNEMYIYHGYIFYK